MSQNTPQLEFSKNELDCIMKEACVNGHVNFTQGNDPHEMVLLRFNKYSAVVQGNIIIIAWWWAKLHPFQNLPSICQMTFPFI